MPAAEDLPPPGRPIDQARLRLAAIVESSDDAILAKDLRGIVTSWNAAAARMFGFAPEEMVGQPITLIIPPERLDEEEAILAAIRRGERRMHFETVRRHRDGTQVPVSLTVSPIRDEAGELIGISKVARDLSEAQRVHAELMRREALLSSILDTVPDALIVIDARGRIHSFSSAAERLFGFTAAEAVGANVNLLMPTPYHEAHDGYLERYVATRERHIIGAGRIVVGRRKDGSTFPMELTVGEVNLAGTQLFTGFVRDLTERQERERRLSEMQSELIHVARLNELGQMAAAIAHEVNQPLTAMTMYLNGIRRLIAAGNGAAALEAMERVTAQADRARQIIQRLRELVRRGEAQRRLEPLPRLIEEAVALALVGSGQDLKLAITVAEDAPEAEIDKIQIQQVLLNLIRNAAEAMAHLRERRLHISVIRDGEMVEFSVADTGPGLAEEVRERLFQPFVTTKSSGMGVGLSVCRTIIEAHGGTIRAEAAPGGGTVFRFTLPAGAG